MSGSAPREEPAGMAHRVTCRPCPFRLTAVTASASSNTSSDTSSDTSPDSPADAPTQEATLWRDDGWTARVIKNIDDDGWAVEMTLDGEAEPALTGPWTMGRDKKNPKPLDANAFHTLVKTASEVLMRHEQHQHALLHKSVTVTAAGMRVTVKLDVEADEDNPSATLSAWDEGDELLAKMNVAPNYSLTRSSAEKWVEGGFKRPRE
jgi:hypothetical protein